MSTHVEHKESAGITMPLNVAINGCGRIGRTLLRAFVQRRLTKQLDTQKQSSNSLKENPQAIINWVAINDRISVEQLTHLIAYDSTYGRFPTPIVHKQDQNIQFLDQSIQVLNQADGEWNWKNLGMDGVDIVIESSGQFRHISDLKKHQAAGAKGTILTAPLLSDDGQLLHPLPEGVSQVIPTLPWPEKLPLKQIWTTHSCTTQALSTLLYPLLEPLKIESVLTTEIHSYTSDQSLLDTGHRDWRRARSATQSIIPTHTWGIESTTHILPQLKGKLQGHSLRIPTHNMACIEVNICIENAISKATLLDIYQTAIEAQEVRNLYLCHEPLVSSDFLQHPGSAIIDVECTMIQGRQIKVFAWYDNEWAYACRVLDLLEEIHLRQQ